MTNKNNDVSVAAFDSAEKWEKWLSGNHHTAKGVWLRLYKKNSGVTSVSYHEAVEYALCYGWIDGQTKKYDDDSYLQKFTPRRPGSIWSKRNVERIEKLYKEGRMKPPGIKEVEAAKADGRWAKAYDPPSEMKVPEDFLQKLEKNKKAKAFFTTLNKTSVFLIAFRLQAAKKPETREKRMTAFIEMLERGVKPK